MIDKINNSDNELTDNKQDCVEKPTRKKLTIKKNVLKNTTDIKNTSKILDAIEQKILVNKDLLTENDIKKENVKIDNQSINKNIIKFNKDRSLINEFDSFLKKTREYKKKPNSFDIPDKKENFYKNEKSFENKQNHIITNDSKINPANNVFNNSTKNSTILELINKVNSEKKNIVSKKKEKNLEQNVNITRKKEIKDEQKPLINKANNVDLVSNNENCEKIIDDNKNININNNDIKDNNIINNANSSFENKINNIIDENDTEPLIDEKNEQREEINPKKCGPIESIELNFLKAKTTPELIEYGKNKVENITDLYRQEMISAILKQFSESNAENTIIGEGVLEVLPDGFGFLRYYDCNYSSSPYDIYVSFSQIKKFALRTGDSIKGTIKAPKKNEKYFSLIKIDAINSQTLEESRHRIRFDDLIPLYPQEKLNLENEADFKIKKDDTCRILDIISPIGKGQRGLIVAPPKTGKTTILQNIAHAITSLNSGAELIVLLIDERPEEVTDMTRSIKGEVVSSTFDEPAFRHVQLAEIVIEKAKRIVETGKDVIILLDSITRLARAYNNVLPSSGKVLTGGVDANALQKPKRFFGAARNIENGGSLTIIATALIDTGSKMDEVIFEEFKGTGNSEILLDRKISDKRIFPAIDIVKSSTRREELLIEKGILSKTWMLRKILSSMDSVSAIEFLKEKLDVTKNNAEFFKNMNS